MILRASGVLHIGTLTDPFVQATMLLDRFAPGHFIIDRPMILRNVFCAFRDMTGSGAGVAALQIYRQRYNVYPHGVQLMANIPAMGIGTRLDFAVPEGDGRERDWVFGGDHGDVVVAWANPDINDVGWELQVRLDEFDGTNADR